MLQPPAKMPARAQHAPDERAHLTPVARADKPPRAEKMIGNRIGRPMIRLDRRDQINRGGKLSRRRHREVPGTGSAGFKAVKGKTPKQTSTLRPKTQTIKSFLLLFFKKEA